ncbi:hypothetical protein BDF21DRAFT_492584 [Thamnidium elegans]|nr:hypothetical protein BDF21DRAFT_492584 [Thamnidium elegans]
MSDLTSELNVITSRLSEKLQTLETEYQRWQDYKTDYDALENQLNTLPDNTTRSAMIPLGKLAFMPGKLIHTNEILVLLGDQYYAERSAKQAVEILKRRREVVNENLGLVEAQLNSFKQKTGAIMNSSALPMDEAQVNEEGLPIMDIREELPSNYDEEQQLKKKKQLEKKPSAPTNQLPESVLRAREMMKEADERINKKKQLEQDAENKALFELLRELEEEEDEQEEKVVVPVMSKFEPKLNKDDDDDDDEDDSNSEDDGRYDTEISENMFDRFGDDEQYPLDGTVDQEDFTCYDELPPQIPAATITEIVEENERSTPKLITKRKSKPAVQQPIADKEPKKLSKFKLAQQEKKAAVSSTVKEDSVTVDQDEVKPKKFSKFKLLRQQQSQPQQDQPRKKVEDTASVKVKEVVQESIAEPVNQPIDHSEQQLTESFETMMIEPKKKSNVPVQDNGIPKVVSKPKKMSRFKLARQAQQHKPEQEVESAPLEQERIKPKRSVTWDANNSVRDHDNTLAPSVVSETASYSQPMKKEETKMSLHQQIKSASDIYRTVQNTQSEMIDDYPSLEEESDAKVDLHELIKAARNSSEAFWKPNDGTEALIPMVRHDGDVEDDEDDEEHKGIIVATRNKLDNKIMKGAVMERDIAPVDLEEVEEDMDMREITSNYQQMRLNMLASTGGLSFATKPEFEVFDEELPLPKKKEDQQEKIEVAPKKMSRFKAARLGMKMQQDDDEEGYYQ